MVCWIFAHNLLCTHLAVQVLPRSFFGVGLRPRLVTVHRDDPKKAILLLMYRYILHATLSGYYWPSLYRAMSHFIMDLVVACTYLVIHHLNEIERSKYVLYIV